MQINRRQFLSTLAGAAIGSSFAGRACGSLFTNNSVKVDLNTTAPQPVDKPNIIFLLIDDLGPEWISCFGADDIETPAYDALAAGGMRFKNAYSMPQCSPSRVTLMTGQYPYHNGWCNHWDVPRWGSGCHFDWEHNTTFARILKTAGYVTAVAGKWQINDFRVTPDAMVKHGFDEYCMWTGAECGNVSASEKRYWDPYIHTKEGSRTYPGGFGDEIFTSFLIDFMRENKDKPMMVYYPMCITHHPYTTTPLMQDNSVSNLMKHKAMVSYVDFCVKRIVDALDEIGIRQRSIIFICGDNGTATDTLGHINGEPIWGGKMKIFENGIWTPLVVNGPGQVPAGVVTDTLTDFTDMLPTFAELAGAEIPVEAAVDGHSIAKVVLGKESDGTREWICGLGAGGSGFKLDTNTMMVVNKDDIENRGIRDKRYKIHIESDKTTSRLYDLQNDPYEKNNLINSTDPEHVAAKAKLRAVFDNLQPSKDASPQYDPLPEWPTPKWDKFDNYVQPK